MLRLRALSKELRRRRVYRAAAMYAGGAFVLVQVAELFLPRLGLPDWVVTALAIAAVVGFPVAVVLAWAFDLTPEGVTRTEGAGGEAVVPSPRRLLMALAVITVMLGTGGWWIATALGGGSVQRLAVLPMVNVAGDPGQEYFAAGMHEALISELAQSDRVQTVLVSLVWALVVPGAGGGGPIEGGGHREGLQNSKSRLRWTFQSWEGQAPIFAYRTASRILGSSKGGTVGFQRITVVK